MKNIEKEKRENYIKGRGAQIKTKNRYEKRFYENDSLDGIDEYDIIAPQTQLFYESPKNIISKNDSPDLNFNYSINPYRVVNMAVRIVTPVTHMNSGALVQV